jgi:exosortase/archaeosortase family protein
MVAAGAVASGASVLRAAGAAVVLGGHVPFLRRIREEVPGEFLAALVVAAVFAVVLVLDQMYGGSLNGIHVRLAGAILRGVCGDGPLAEDHGGAAQRRGESVAVGLRRLIALGFGAAMAVGAVCFLLGALYHAGSGVTQPGSLALAIGFAGLMLGMLYFAAPQGCVCDGPAPTGLRALGVDARLRVVSLFVFPALIWMLSAPLVSAVENQLSLFLLRKVVAVVSFVFNLLGFPLIQEGSTLVLPGDDRVGVEDACSGIRSLTACLFTGSFLAAVFLDRWWKKAALIGAALVLAVFTNLLRSLFLTSWAYSHGSRSISGTFHDATGYAVLGVTFVGLLCLLPLFSGANWLRWLTPKGAADTSVGGKG